MSYKDKEKQKEYSRNWVSKRRLDFFKDKKCEICGSTERLELHHINKEDKEDHKIWSWSIERRNKEIKKCVIWCRDCHEEHHAEEKRRPITHGTVSGYRRGCRCSLCTETQKIRMKNYHKKVKLAVVVHLGEHRIANSEKRDRNSSTAHENRNN